MEKKKSLFREYAEAIVIAIILAMVIRTFVIQAFKIPSGSMIPTLVVGDHILVNKFIYCFKEPQKGDIIVFKYPDDHKIDYIKRTIGVEGDEIQIKDKQVYINGKMIEEPYIIHNDSNIIHLDFNPRDNYGPVIVPKDSYFMMGDNRDSSRDSRYWGFVKRDEIRGKAFVIYWSWNKEKFRVRWNRLAKILH